MKSYIKENLIVTFCFYILLDEEFVISLRYFAILSVDQTRLKNVTHLTSTLRVSKQRSPVIFSD